MENSTQSRDPLRPAQLSMCVILMGLFLSAPVLTSHSIQTRIWRPVTGEGWPNEFNSYVAEASLHKESSLHFLQPLQSVNDSQGLNQPVQVGAWGDAASVGNTGVQVEIRTNTYNVSSQQNDAFWVGDVLGDGSFVQFGYLILPPGYYCLNAHITEGATACSGTGDNVQSSDARWFWAYFPNAEEVGDWYYGFGPANSAGSNSTWHLYSILPSASSDWSFMMDGVTVYSSNFPSTTSTSPAHIVAEKASGPYLSQLGPVEFRDLAYLTIDSQWHATSSLSLIDGCGAADSNGCTVSSAYGVESVGPNDIIAGSYMPASGPGQIIWERQSTCTLGTTLLASGSVGNAPLNVTFTDSVLWPQGSFRTDWWFGNGSHEAGNSNQTFTYSSPGNYTPLVRVLDSAGCLSEASGQVSVAAANSSTAAVSSFLDFVTIPCAFSLRHPSAPGEMGCGDSPP